MTGESMKQLDLVGAEVKLILKENVLAITSQNPLTTVSSAIHNGGGLKTTKIIINSQVTDEYGDRHLHDDPTRFVLESFKKLGFNEGFVGMVTYANVADFALVSKTDGDIAVSVVATAGCTHAESAGEKIEVQKIEGTINIIVVIDGNPVESCLVSTLITATEAKTAALRELDLRSRYSGNEATGTITDAMVVAKTGKGLPILYGGPASKLGQIVGHCTRKAVKDAVMNSKIGGYLPTRSILERLSERNLALEKLAFELAKVKRLNATEKTIHATLKQLLDSDPLFSVVVLAALRLSDDFKVGLVPPQLGDVNFVGEKFGEFLSKQTRLNYAVDEFDLVDLPPFFAQVFVVLLENAFSEKKNWKP
jgi:adenosylcobinamide amidohydrolase